MKKGFPGYDLHRDIGDNVTPDWNPKNVYATELFTDEAEKIIDNHDPGVPLYLHFSHLAPHRSGRENGLEVRDIQQVNETFRYIDDYSRRLYAGNSFKLINLYRYFTLKYIKEIAS